MKGDNFFHLQFEIKKLKEVDAEKEVNQRTLNHVDPVETDPHVRREIREH